MRQAVSEAEAESAWTETETDTEEESWKTYLIWLCSRNTAPRPDNVKTNILLDIHSLTRVIG